MAAGDPNTMTTGDILTVIAAVWGAVLGTYAAILSTLQHVIGRSELKREVQVTLFKSLAKIDTEAGTASYGLFAKAVNTGKRPVTLYDPWFMTFPEGLYGGIFEANPGVSFPIELADGQECTVRVKAEALASGLEQHGDTGNVALVAVFRDATGGVHQSEQMMVTAAMLRELLP